MKFQHDVREIRNPFGVMDVPDPNGQDVYEFAAQAQLGGSAEDANAQEWHRSNAESGEASLEGEWFSRWNGGADPTIPEDAEDKWKQGQAKISLTGDRVYIIFDWNNGVRKGLIDSQREGTNKLSGRYINLTDPTIIRPWFGLIVDNQRIDGRFPEGRLDFRR